MELYTLKVWWNGNDEDYSKDSLKSDTGRSLSLHPLGAKVTGDEDVDYLRLFSVVISQYVGSVDLPSLTTLVDDVVERSKSDISTRPPCN